MLRKTHKRSDFEEARYALLIVNNRNNKDVKRYKLNQIDDIVDALSTLSSTDHEIMSRDYWLNLREQNCSKSDDGVTLFAKFNTSRNPTRYEFTGEPRMRAFCAGNLNCSSQGNCAPMADLGDPRDFECAPSA